MVNNKSKLKAQVNRKFKIIMKLAKFNDLLDIDDYLADWQSNLRERC